MEVPLAQAGEKHVQLQTSRDEIAPLLKTEISIARRQATEGTEDVLDQVVSVLLPEFGSYPPRRGSDVNVKRGSGQNESIKAIIL